LFQSPIQHPAVTTKLQSHFSLYAADASRCLFSMSNRFYGAFKTP
jgi:hypothetical protein